MFIPRATWPALREDTVDLPDVVVTATQDVLDLSGVTTGTREGVAIGRRGTGPLRRIDTEGYNWDAEVTVSEDHEDDLVITQHPVEYGAAITDHAYKQPSQLRLRVGWSASYVGDVRKVYEDILYLQEARRPFKITTGKRDYDNMLIASIRTQTNSTLEYTFLADITFQQILLVSTQTISGAQNAANHAEPAKTQPTVSPGDKQTTPTTLSTKQADDAGADVAQASAIAEGFVEGTE
jgi:hypothetical protein